MRALYSLTCGFAVLAQACSSGTSTAVDSGPTTDSGSPPAFCTIQGVEVPNAGTDSSNACLVCQPAINATTWSQVADGSA